MTSRSKAGRREQRENSKNDNELTKIEANAADSKKEVVDEALEASLLHSLNLSTAQEEVESGSADQSQMHSAREGKAAVQNNKLESPTGAQLARMENHELPDDMEFINKERHGKKKKKETKKGHHHFSEGTNAEKNHHDELQPPDVNKKGEEHETDWDNYEYDSDDQNHHGVLASASSPSNSAIVSASAASELSVIVTKVDVIQKPEKKTVNSTKLAGSNRRPIVANGKPLLQTAASEYTVDSKDLDHSVIRLPHTHAHTTILSITVYILFLFMESVCVAFRPLLVFADVVTIVLFDLPYCLCTYMYVGCNFTPG